MLFFLFLLSPTHHLLHSHPSHHAIHQAPILYYHNPHPQPGIGDRLRSLLSAYIFSAFSNRVLVANLDRPPFAHLLPARLNTSRAIAPTYNITSVHRPLNLSPLFSKTPAIKIERYPSASIALINTIARTHPNLSLSKAVLEYGTPQGEQHLFGAILTMMFDVHASLNRLLMYHPSAARIVSQKYVAIHARLGEGVGESRGRFDRPISRDQLARCFATRVQSMAKNHNVNSVYVATDTPSFVQLVERYITWGHVMSLGGDRIHTAKCTDGKDQRCRLVILELLLLSRAKGIVALQSSFAQVASYFGNITDHQVLKVEHCNKHVNKSKLLQLYA